MLPATKGVTIGVRHVRADWSSSNDLANAKFGIKMANVWAHRSAWALAGTIGQDRINRKIELTEIE